MKPKKFRKKQTRIRALLKVLKYVSTMLVKFRCKKCNKFECGWGYNIWVPDWCMDCVTKSDEGVISHYSDTERAQIIEQIGYNQKTTKE